MPDDNKNNNDGGNESDSKKTKTQNQPFDPTKLSDEDFNKVFDDDRLWKHERFKELNDNAKAGKAALEKIKKFEEDKLKEEGKYKELTEKYKAEADEAKKALEKANINAKIQAEATKQGAGDLEAVLALINRESIKIDENGNITGADEAVKGLLENKPYLKGNQSNPPVKIGSGTQPSGDPNASEKFTLSQIQDPVFYRAHEKEIDAAQRAGNIVDDQGGTEGTPGQQS